MGRQLECNPALLAEQQGSASLPIWESSTPIGGLSGTASTPAGTEGALRSYLVASVGLGTFPPWGPSQALGKRG